MRVTENDEVRRPVPPVQGSKPAWTLVRYQLDFTTPARVASRTKSVSGRFDTEVTGVLRTKEITGRSIRPYQTSQRAPASVIS